MLVAEVLAPEFYADKALDQSWRAFVQGQPIGSQIEPEIPGVGDRLRPFLEPLASAAGDTVKLLAWDAATGWTTAATN